MKISPFLPLLLLATSAFAQETPFCLNKCEQEKRQCRLAADARIRTDTNPPLQVREDKARDMQGVLAEGQRAVEAERSLRGERYGDCATLFAQCQKDCRTADAGAVDILLRK